MKTALLSNNLILEIEKRITGELKAELMYRTLANCMQNEGYFGAASFFLDESKAEAAHYQKLIDFCNDLGVLPDIQMPMNYTYTEGGLESAFKVAFNAEFLLMREYAELIKLAKAQDVILEEFLYFFIREQRKSVGEYGDFLARLELCKNEASALLIFDNELKK